MSQNRVNPDWDEIFIAWLTTTWKDRAYYDRRTGCVVWVSEWTRARLQRVYDEFGEVAGEDNLESADLLHAHLVELDDDRFPKIPEITKAERRALYDSFAEACEPPFRRLLWSALDADDYNRFVLMLDMEPAEHLRWKRHCSDSAATALNQLLA